MADSNLKLPLCQSPHPPRDGVASGGAEPALGPGGSSGPPVYSACLLSYSLLRELGYRSVLLPD